MRLLNTTLRAFLLVLLPIGLWATAPVDLGSAAPFAVLAGSTVTNTGSSVIQGDLGLSPGTSVTGFPPGLLAGTQYIADGVAAQAQTDLVTAYDDAAGRTPTATIPTELGGSMLTPGVYNSPSGTFGITGSLVLDGLGDPDAVFIFQMESTLITGTASTVDLVGGADPCNIHWQVGSSATLGTDSRFKGNILALASITLTTGAWADGRMLARNGAVTLDTNMLDLAGCSGGSAGTADNPVDFVLSPAYPNPFNPSTRIGFTLSHTGQVKLTVHDLLGRSVAVLQDGLLAQGQHSVSFELPGLPSGVYSYSLEVEGRALTRSMTLLK